MSEIISTSVSAAAILSAEETCGFEPKRNDMMSAYGAEEIEVRKGVTLAL
jgi:hypothetical protein